MSYPVIYAENATDFFNLGLGTLPDATKVEVAEERNGEFTLVMTYLVDGLRANEIKKNRIIKVDAGHVLKGQRFVIKKINKQLVDRKIQYQVYAEHVSYITNDLQLKPKVSVSGSGDAAIKAWRSNIIDVNPLVVDSDIETNTSTSWTIDKVQSARQALGGVAGSLLDLWGGEYRFDNYHISLKKQRGTVSNTLLSYGRNITDFDQEENITDTYTSVYPYATYTETTENSSDSESKLLTLPELTIDSKYVGNYPNRKILPVDLTAKFAAGEKPTEAKLREFAKSYVTANDIGVPKVSIKLSFVDLSQSSNYEALQLLEALDLCDTVPVRFTKLGVDTKTKVSRVVWDVLADHYTSMELGDTRYTIGDMINNAVDTANEANQNSQEAQNSANHAVISADGHTMIFYGPGTPSAKNIGDLWYKPDGEYEILYRWDGKVWSFVMSTRDTAEAKDAADKASKEAEEAKNQANKAVDGANQAVAEAGFANDTADQAKSDAAAAGQQAKDALTSAGTAITDAKKALTDSGSAMVDSAQARKDSATAIKDAADSLTSAKDAINKVGNLTTSVTSQFTTVDNELKSKVNQTDYDKLKGTVTSQQTDISQNANSIKLKADKSYADTINNSVVKNTSSVGLLNDQIALTVSKTELNNTLSSYATQTWTQSQIKSTADQINLSVSQVQSNLDNMHIGSRNYLKSSDTVVQLHGVTQTYSNGVWANQWYVRFQPIQRYTEDVWVFSTDYIPIAPTPAQPKLAVGVMNHEDTKLFTILGDFPVIDGRLVAAIDLSKVDKRFDSIIVYSSYSGWGNSKDKKAQFDHYQMERATKVSDWCPAPEDAATEVQFSQLQLTVNGIQGTVQNKADQSQVTQLANQITSTVRGLGQQNLLLNTSFDDLSYWWGDTTVWHLTSWGFNGAKGIYIDSKDSAWHELHHANVPLEGKHAISASAHMFIERAGNGAVVGAQIRFYDKTGKALSSHYLSGNDGKTGHWMELKIENIQQPVGADHAVFLFTGFGDIRANLSNPMVVSDSVAGPFVSSDVSQSQITQLANDINLRVQKNDVVNQINISPEGILIDGKKIHITGQTSIDNAVIKDAMIADIKADKITAGTLNAANVNVINLNANNITTGTIRGANLSMNLNTGEVLFQKGSIKSSDGTFAVDIDNQTITSTDNSHNGIVLKHGELLFYKGINAGSGSAEFGRMDVAFFNGGGLKITGYNGLTLGTEITGLYEANLALVSPKNNSGKSSASLVGDVIYLQPSPGNLKGEINISGKTDIAGSVSVVGDLGVIGKKNAIHPTNDGIRETPAYETAESYLGDIGEGVTDESGRALIHIDALFNQIINTDYDYQVFVSSYSNAIVWVEEREKASFEIHSNISNAKFAWEIKAKRRGYETDRLVKSEMKYERLNKFHEKKVSA